MHIFVTWLSSVLVFTSIVQAQIDTPAQVTIKFNNISIRNVIGEIAIAANQEITISNEVKGSIGLRLKNVAWKDALEAVVKTAGCHLIAEPGNVWRVVSRRKTRVFKLHNIALQKTPTVYLFNFQKALKQALGYKGKVTYNIAANTITVTDTKNKLNDVSKVIRHFDREPNLIAIDVKFVQTTNSDYFKMAGFSSHKTSSFKIFSPSQAKSILNFLKRDAKSRIIQYSKTVVLNNSKATFFMYGTGKVKSSKAHIGFG